MAYINNIICNVLTHFSSLISVESLKWEVATSELVDIDYFATLAPWPLVISMSAKRISPAVASKRPRMSEDAPPVKRI